MIDSISEEAEAGVDLKRSKRRRRPALDPAKLDRLPPHSTEAEQGVLGCILWNPACIAEIQKRFVLREPYFYDLRHKEIYDAAHAMHRHRDAIDLITLQQRLKDGKMLDLIGGIPYLQALQDSVPSAANLSYYLDILCEKTVLRRTIRICSDIVSRAYENEGEVDDLIDAAEIDIVQVSRARQPLTVSRRTTLLELEQIDFADKSDVLLGNDWIERGAACQIAAASGVGKSTLEIQMSVLFALGRDFCGIQPTRCLKSVIIYAENSDRDNARALRSIIQKLGVSLEFTPEDHALVSKNVVFREVYHASGPEFVSLSREIANEERPDLMWLDPLAAYAGDDLSKQTTIATFLRKGLHPIAKDIGFAWMIINHYTKPNENRKANTVSSDHQYRGAGSYDISGWTRAGVTVSEVGHKTYEIRFNKRGDLAGAMHPDKSPTTVVWAKHAMEGIFWEQIDPPQESEPSDKKGGAPSKVDKLISLGLGPVIDSLTTVTGKNDLARKLDLFAGSRAMDASLSTCKRAIEILVGNGAIKKVEGGYLKV